MIFHTPYSFLGTPNLNFASSNEMAEALKSLTNSIDKLMTQLQDQQRLLSRPQSGNFALSTIICFTCVNNRPPVTNNNQGVNNNNPTLNRNDSQEALQALLALMNNNLGVLNNAGNQALYLGILDDKLLFLPADRPI
ncbi:19634_t:CDS:2, partial [Racocetra persica]